jgi:hypothetical protein
MPKPDHRSQMARAWLHFHAARKGRGSGSAAPRVDWPVYSRRAEHNTVAEGGNRRSTIAASSQALALLVGLVHLPPDPSRSVRAMASNASAVMAMRIKRQARRVSDLLQPAFFVFTPQRSPENRWAASVSHVGRPRSGHRREREATCSSPRAERPYRPTGNNHARSSA